MNYSGMIIEFYAGVMERKEKLREIMEKYEQEGEQ